MNQNGGSLTDTLVKLVLIFFISLLSFSVGTFVGKQFAEGQRKYSSLEADYNSHRDTASVSPDSNDVKPEEALTDEDIANLTEEFVKSEKEKGKDIMKHDVAEKGEEKPAEKVAEKSNEKEKPQVTHEGDRTVKVLGSTTGHKEEATASKAHEMVAEAATAPMHVSEPAMRVAKGETPTMAHAAEKRSPSSLPAATAESSVGKYTVQIAAYGNEEEAQKRVQNLKEKGVSAFTVTAQKNGRNWYRVVVGLYGTQKDANTAREDLTKQQAELKDAFVQKIIQ
jgi:cell division protein FtsN